MHILIANNTTIPALKYGGTERVIWWLGKELSRRGHKVTYLVSAGSSCPFANTLVFDPSIPFDDQIPDDVDVVHSNFRVLQEMKKPFIVTMHGYNDDGTIFDLNTVFVSKRHAEIHRSSTFVHNGLDPEEYGRFDHDMPRSHLLFLAAIRRSAKNLKGAIVIAKKAGQDLAIVGGWGLSFNRHIRYYGLLGGEAKNAVIRRSSALIFPVLWDEPFGLALIEAMYHGCPVIGTPYGALPEIITKDTGVLSTSLDELVDAAADHSQFNRQRIHEHVMANFTSVQMTNNYLALYERVISGEAINQSVPHRIPESFSMHYPIQ